MRAVAIGLDAAEWPHLRTLLDAGALPHLAQIRSRSREAALHNDFAWRYGLVWQQFLYGQPATNDGAWDPMFFDPKTYRAWQRNAAIHWHRRPFYDRDGVDVIAFDVPALVPSDPPRGVQVVAWGASAPLHVRASQPPGLLREIDRRFGPHPAFDNDYEVTWYDRDRVATLIDALEVGAARRMEIAAWLFAQRPECNLFVTVMSELHAAGEFLWHAVDAAHLMAGDAADGWACDQLVRVYTAIDRAVGAFAAGLDDDTALVVFSLYGTASSPGDTVSIALLPELLHRLDGGAPRLRSRDLDEWAAAGFPPIIPKPGVSWEGAMDALWAGPPVQPDPLPRSARVRDAITNPGGTLRALRSRRQPPVPGALDVAIEAETYLTPKDVRGRPGNPLQWQFSARYRDRWPSMKAFALPTFSDGLIRVNLEGREASGVVAPEEFGGVLDEVEEALQACRDPRTGAPVISEIVRFTPDARSALRPGAPFADLAVRWAGPLDAIEHPRAGLIGPCPLHRTGTHSANGFAFVTGPGIARADIGERDALDLPPTLLELLGIRAQDDLCGRSFLS